MSTAISADITNIVTGYTWAFELSSHMPLALPAELNRQCLLAAYSSRLNPYTLHQGEIELLKGRTKDDDATIYLQIRNSILRLWTRNPLICVSRDEAVDCVRKDRRYGPLAAVAHEWLARNGFINFGCIQPSDVRCSTPGSAAKQKTVVIIGAGISGLACARQLLSIFKQFPERWAKHRKERLPRVVVLEGRNRIGGRVYSHPLRAQKPGSLPHGLANTAEIGAQIITGFEHGNPLNVIIRGQLALPYHSLRDNLLLYDFDGSVIEDQRDARVQTMFNDILEAASEHSWKPAIKVSTNGMRSYLAPLKDNLHSDRKYDGTPAVDCVSCMALFPCSNIAQLLPVRLRLRRIPRMPGQTRSEPQSSLSTAPADLKAYTHGILAHISFL